MIDINLVENIVYLCSKKYSLMRERNEIYCSSFKKYLKKWKNRIKIIEAEIDEIESQLYELNKQESCKEFINDLRWVYRG